MESSDSFGPLKASNEKVGHYTKELPQEEMDIFK